MKFLQDFKLQPTSKHQVFTNGIFTVQLKSVLYIVTLGGGQNRARIYSKIYYYS
jgi:hypothetical protein